jgi:hypothetical protein
MQLSLAFTCLPAHPSTYVGNLPSGTPLSRPRKATYLDRNQQLVNNIRPRIPLRVAAPVAEAAVHSSRQRVYLDRLFRLSPACIASASDGTRHAATRPPPTPRYSTTVAARRMHLAHLGLLSQAVR